jgi:hypothetical protein
MKTNATMTLKLTMCLYAALVIVALAWPPAVGATDSVDCSPATCTSPVFGPGNHLDVETR